MPRIDLGGKQICPNCAARFYDLGRRPATCPKCSNAFDPDDEVVKIKRQKTRAAAVAEVYADDEEEVVARPENAEEVEEEPIEARELGDDADEPPPTTSDEDEDEPIADDADIPDGFSEDDEVLEEDDAAGIPLLEDEEEIFDGELGELDEADENREEM